MSSVIGNNVQLIKETIRVALAKAGRDNDKVELVAVSKNQPAISIIDAFDSGVSTFGENYVKEALDKITEVKKVRPNAKFHFIGHLQSNKANLVAPVVDCIETIDTLKLARKIDDFIFSKNLRPIEVFFQVNVSKELTKSGFDPSIFSATLKDLVTLKNLKPKGLMMIGENSRNFDSRRKQFAELRMLRDNINEQGYKFSELSMGMSEDYEIAIEEGASVVRIGSAIFGERQY